MGLVQGGQDGADWEHTLGKPGDEDHTLMGNHAGNRCSFRRSLDFTHAFLRCENEDIQRQISH